MAHDQLQTTIDDPKTAVVDLQAKVNEIIKLFSAPSGRPDNPKTGTIVLNGSTFEGWNGSAWVTLG